jgi:hypothetical protein
MLDDRDRLRVGMDARGSQSDAQQSWVIRYGSGALLRFRPVGSASRRPTVAMRSRSVKLLQEERFPRIWVLTPAERDVHDTVASSQAGAHAHAGEEPDQLQALAHGGEFAWTGSP